MAVREERAFSEDDPMSRDRDFEDRREERDSDPRVRGERYAHDRHDERRNSNGSDERFASDRRDSREKQDREWDLRGRAATDDQQNPADDRVSTNDNSDRFPRDARDRNPPRMPDAHAMGDTYVMALKRSANLVGDSVRTFQNHAARFASRRMERDIEAMEDIARSGSLLELFAIQQRWLSSVASDYSDEMIRLARIASTSIEDSAGAATNRMRDR